MEATMTAIEVKHYGNVRGGGNEYARLHLHILVPEIPNASASTDEMRAIFDPWDEMFGLQGSAWVGWDYKVSNRREFALVPVIIRKAQAAGFDLAVSQWDTGLKGKVKLSEEPALFWQTIALAQMWFEK